MLTTHTPARAQEEKVELILVLQQHKPDGVKFEKGAALDNSALGIVFSQFNIMKILPSYPEAAVLVEGAQYDVTPNQRDIESLINFRNIFPDYKTLQAMDFDNLTQDQKHLLVNRSGTQILFKMGLIPYIYQTTGSKINSKELNAAYLDSHKECVKNYPKLAFNVLRTKSFFFQDLVTTFNELEEYKHFQKLLHQKNPIIFYQREKEALDFVLAAAKRSGKKQVILIYGKLHADGFCELINTTFRDQITLTRCIDSLEGFNEPDAIKQLEIENKEGARLYTSGEYKKAADLFKRQAGFWQATPKSTPTKFPSLRAAEFNLGSVLFKLAESDEGSYSAAIPHLKNAVTLCSETQDRKLNSKKYTDRYSDAVKRRSVILFFNDIFNKPNDNIPRLIARYVTDEEIPTSKPQKPR